MISLKGRKALITGGSRGIGRSTAILFAEAGSDVGINYLNQSEAAKEVRGEIEKIGRECLIFKADISQKRDIISMIRAVIKRWGQIDILVNNAGIWTYGEMGNMPEEIWEETIRINLDGVYYTCNAVIPYMKEKKRGSIINVSSTAAVRGEAFHSHYAASKGAIVSLSKSLAVELAPYNIRVNSVAPGWVDTDMCAQVFSDPKFRKKVQDSIPLGRIPPPEDIAGAILFLASDLASYITGEVLNVNGGSVLCS
jgi:3-oxoacyl-[acyl-carrier protein] reductase